MFYQIAADLLVVLHVAFVVFVVAGGFLVWRWRRLAYVHVPAAVWGALIEFQSGLCPLTPLENWLRQAGGQDGYRGGFIEHYILPILYPAGHGRDVEIVLGSIVIVCNILIYARLLVKRR